MVCIYCGHETSVTNSRLNKRLNSIWRRRACASCGNIFSTYEQADRAKAWRVVKDNKLRDFDRDHLFISLYKSCGHRPAAISDAGHLAETVVALLAKRPNGTISTQELSQTAYDVLARFDSAAATHYAAFHPQAGLYL
jgi:transcriptional repressor NrdR